jgi:hypothetical protein
MTTDTTIDLVPLVNASLDNALTCLKAGEFHAAFDILGDDLSAYWDRANGLSQQAVCKQLAREHEIFSVCQSDPYTSRAYTKPRGYAGDAVMLDYVYGGRAPAETTSIGQGIFWGTTQGPMGLSVLFRRNLLTAYINDIVARNPRANILSVASGHCRELDGTHALNDQFRGTFTAFDQDKESLADVDARYGDKVKTIVGNVKRLMMGAYELGKFDFIYSAGLYDYLPTEVALKLTAVLKTMLAPKGRLLIANFSTQSHGRAYLDWMMDWQLILRTEDEFSAITNVASGQEGKVATFTDPHGNVIYSDFKNA